MSAWSDPSGAGPKKNKAQGLIQLAPNPSHHAAAKPHIPAKASRIPHRGQVEADCSAARMPNSGRSSRWPGFGLKEARASIPLPELGGWQ